MFASKGTSDSVLLEPPACLASPYSSPPPLVAHSRRLMRPRACCTCTPARRPSSTGACAPGGRRAAARCQEARLAGTCSLAEWCADVMPPDLLPPALPSVPPSPPIVLFVQRPEERQLAGGQALARAGLRLQPQPRDGGPGGAVERGGHQPTVRGRGRRGRGRRLCGHARRAAWREGVFPAGVCFQRSRPCLTQLPSAPMPMVPARWLAPEILSGKGYTFASDVYSFG